METKVFALVAFLSMFVMASAQNLQHRQVYCGRDLSEALASLCDNLIKRSEPRHPQVDANWPWIPQHSAHSLSRSKRQLVVSECCEKPCSISELVSYCAY